MAGRPEDEEQSEPSDEALIEQARDGRVAAFEVLLQRYEGRVLRVVRLLGVQARDREDVAQEVFVRVFRHLQGFRRGQPFQAWIYRIAVNAAHDWRRRSRRRDLLEVAWSAAAETSADPSPDPAERAEEGDRRRHLERALVDLSERERAVFVLREIEGLETWEIARALGITRITVRRHLGLARRRLQGSLSRIGEAIPQKKTDPD